LRQRFQNIIFPEGIFYDGNEFIGTDKKSCIFQLIEAETCRTSTLAPIVDEVRTKIFAPSRGIIVPDVFIGL
jgi:hypothetical protein